MQYFLWGGNRKLEQMLTLGGKDRGHHSMGVELFAGVADVLPDGVDAYAELPGNFNGAKSRRQLAEHLQLPWGERKFVGSARAGFIDRSLVEHVDEDDLVSVVGGDERDDGHPFAFPRGALHSYVGCGRNSPMLCCDDRWAVPAAEGCHPVVTNALRDVVTLPPKSILRLVAQDHLSLGIPENDVLFHVDGVGPVWGVLQPVEETGRNRFHLKRP